MNSDERDNQRLMQNLKRRVTKHYNRIYQPVDPQTPHLTFLQSLTKSELDEIRKFWNFRGISSLKKADLAKELAQLISANLSQWLVCLDRENVKLLEDLLANDGVLINPAITLEQIHYFRRRGTIFTGLIDDTKALVMPQELIPLTRELLAQPEIRNQIQVTDELFLLTKGIVTYYGAVYSLNLSDMVEDLASVELQTIHYFTAMKDWAEFDFDLTIDGLNLVLQFVDDPRWVLSEQAKRPELDFYPLTRQQALAAGRRGFFEPTLAQKRFVKYLLNNWEMTQEHAEMIVKEVIISLNNSDQITPIQEIELLREFIEIETFELMQEVTDYIVQLHNNSPQWVLKGHAPNQISRNMEQNASPFPASSYRPEPEDDKPQPIVKGPKIGRNDPCPCGSGKKYKKCCGR